MTWMLAITIIATMPFILAFALFLTIYFSELAREKRILKDYQDQIDKGAAAIKDMRLVYEAPVAKPKTSKPADPIPDPDKGKKAIN